MRPSYEQIEKQLAEIGIAINALPKTEMKALPEVLHDNESIKGIAHGLYEDRGGVLVATNERVIFFYKGRLWGAKVEEFRYEKITSIKYSTGLIADDIIIYVAGNAAKIEMVPKGFCQIFVEAVQQSLGKQDKTTATSASDEFLAKLERLVALKKSGMLTDEEFKTAKMKLLEI